MDAAPVWSDVCTFDAQAWRGRVDCVVAGFPCQDLSVAGRRAGLDGKRSGLFFEVVRIATDSGAWLLFLENVAGIATATASVVDAAEGKLEERAAARVLGELADLGWDAEWVTLAASDVGASHGRARWFCVAWRAVADANHDGREGCALPAAEGWQRQTHLGRPSCELGDTDGSRRTSSRRRRNDSERPARAQPEQSGGGAVAHADSTERPGARFVGEAGRPESGVACGAVADTSCARLPIRRGGGSDLGPFQQPGRREPAGVHPAFAIFAPGPTDPGWPAVLADRPELAPALEPAFRCVVDGLAFDMGDSRAARLKCIGNGVVALQAAAAFVVLARRAGILNHIETIRRAA